MCLYFGAFIASIFAGYLWLYMKITTVEFKAQPLQVHRLQMSFECVNSQGSTTLTNRLLRRLFYIYNVHTQVED